VKALEDNNANVGAGYMERNGEQYLIRSPGQLGVTRRMDGNPSYPDYHSSRRLSV
jgi:Cu/Ag efflux pump CusA